MQISHPTQLPFPGTACSPGTQSISYGILLLSFVMHTMNFMALRCR